MGWVWPWESTNNEDTRQDTKDKMEAADKAGQLFGGAGKMDTAMDKGMERGKALGTELMSDPELQESRGQLKGQLSLSGPNKDLINQQASKKVEQMRYKGAKLSPIQQVEAQRKLASDQGAQGFMEDQQKAKDIYNLDLQKAKFLGQMSMSGALAATSSLEQPKERSKILGIF